MGKRKEKSDENMVSFSQFPLYERNVTIGKKEADEGNTNIILRVCDNKIQEEVKKRLKSGEVKKDSKIVKRIMFLAVH